MRLQPRLAALAAVAAVALTGCAGDPAPDPGTVEPPGATVPATTLPAEPAPVPPAPPGGTAAPGVTQPSDVYGPGCAQLPVDGPGSAPGAADDPVGTVARDNPLLGTLFAGLTAAGLVDPLNDPSAEYTVFAPADTAFRDLPPGTLESLLADPAAQLTDVLTYHVVPQRYDAQGLAEAGTVTTLQGADLAITGEPTALTIDEQERATVLCGNIPAANATVFVIDTVLMPPA